MHTRRQCRVLLVDAAADTRQRAAFRLSCDGHEVTQLGSSEEALRTLCSADAPGDHFDLVVLDARLPQLSGITTLSVLRANGFERPVILTSGVHDAITDAQAAALDAPLLAKPFALNDLSARVGQLLARTP